MVFKNKKYVFVFIIVFYGFISCNNNRKYKSINKQIVIIDTIVFGTANSSYTYYGSRLYPTTNDFNNKEITELRQADIVSVEQVGDSLFVFVNNNFVYYESNPNFPAVNDSLFKSFYPKYFDVTIDDDMPYFVYLESDKDFVSLVRNIKNGEFCWETAIVQNTVLSFFSGVKVGMSKEEVFLKLKLPIFDFDKRDFSLFLFAVDSPDEIWYNKFFDSKKYLYNTKIPEVPVLFIFKENKLNIILIDMWIGYGKNDFLSHLMKLKSENKRINAH